jgi:Ca2+-binding EF-hand superfamily protein
MKYVQTPIGEREFFHRTIFEAFDQDGNGYLEAKEIDDFLTVYYATGKVIAGDNVLPLPPSKEEVKYKALHELDANGDGKLEFKEIRGLLAH